MSADKKKDDAVANEETNSVVRVARETIEEILCRFEKKLPEAIAMFSLGLGILRASGLEDESRSLAERFTRVLTRVKSEFEFLAKVGEAHDRALAELKEQATTEGMHA